MDTCDRCAARALVTATMPSGGEVLLCGHHGDQYAPVLRAQGATLLDEREFAAAPAPA